MDYWLQLPQGGWSATRENVRLFALMAEELGFNGLWLGDHIVIPVDYQSQYPYGVQHPVGPDRPFLEAYTVLSYLAGMTDRVRLAVTVAIGPYRHPLLHAKVAATLDHLSCGRLEIGVGTGWLREEFDALGVDFEHRQQVTDEYLDAMQLLWTGQPVRFEGTRISFDTVQCLPAPTQQPHPPLWIGGSSRRAFDRMRRFDAGWLGPDMPVTDFVALLSGFRDSCAVLGRPAPRVSAKVWIEPPAARVPDSLSVSPTAPTNFELLALLEDSGTTDIRIDLSRLATADRAAATLALARALRKEKLLGHGG
jgi:probable F420-dependent oxidoreductase